MGRDISNMSRFMRYAVCAVLGFGVLSMFLSSSTDPANEPSAEMAEALLPVVDAPVVTEAPKVEQTARRKVPKMSEQALYARDRRAKEREKRSAQAQEVQHLETDTVTIRDKK